MKYTTRKYEGDDAYSWAIFRAQDVKGMRGIIFYGDAQPVMTGLSMTEARSRAKRLTQEGSVR
ncbi:MAG: hypothetical protein ACW987_19990 [Candidatus Thorarchaeota archaeon]|jgi:hypothetical protein